MKYYYKASKVNKELYMQIWERDENGDRYLLSLGSAQKCYKKLVEAKRLKEQTKKIGESLTNLKAED